MTNICHKGHYGCQYFPTDGIDKAGGVHGRREVRETMVEVQVIMNLPQTSTQTTQSYKSQDAFT
jgi:hypothetical protein